MDPTTFYDIEIELSRGDMSVGWVYGVLGVHPWLVGLMDDRAAKDIWGQNRDERLCSSLLPAGAATATEGGFRLSGHWRFSSGCHYAGWAILGGIIGHGKGTPDVRMFLLPRSDYRIEDAWHVSGLNGTGSDDVVVEDAFVPEYRTRRVSENLECTGAGQALNQSPLYRMPFGQIFFRGVSCPLVGALQCMLDEFVAYARQRAGIAGKAMEDPIVQQVCAEVGCAIDEIRTVLRRNMDVLRQHADRAERPPMLLRQQFKFQSAWAADRCAKLAARLMAATGAAGIYDSHSFGRVFADISAGRQHVANQFEMVGRNLGASMLGASGKPDFML
jgi:3-hydroxy-9,10-secoandrosta-1,3,5(10)-triene-9,17-dione monooxygenase